MSSEKGTHREDSNESICISSDEEGSSSAAVKKKRVREQSTPQKEFLKKPRQEKNTKSTPRSRDKNWRAREKVEARPSEQDPVSSLCNHADILGKLIQKSYKPKGEIKDKILLMTKLSQKIREGKGSQQIDTPDRRLVSARGKPASGEKGKNLPEREKETAAQIEKLIREKEELQNELLMLKRQLNEQSNRIKNLEQASRTNGKGYQDLEGYLDIPWPQHTYLNTDEVSPELVQDASWDLALVVDRNSNLESQIIKMVTRKYPEILNLLDFGVAGLEYLVQTIRSSRAGAVNTEKAIFVITVEGDDNEVAFKSLELLKQKMNELGRNRIIALADPIHLRKPLRNMMEFLLRDCVIRCGTLFTRKVREGRFGRQKSRTRGNKPRVETVTIQQEGKSYADTLKELKKRVDIEKMGIGIQGIRKTEQGKLQIRVKGGGNQGDTLKRAIEKTLKEAVVKVQTKQTTLHVMGIEGDMSSRVVLIFAIFEF
ncbi:hypothetical protein ABEB36_013580 [Hypothenemus hampei]|uniref:Uncharacterized protein n=1 Tax=Hypothenemus hampei TaxID=57062 RepID=A0ABD1E4M6_HYPHA